MCAPGAPNYWRLALRGNCACAKIMALRVKSDVISPYAAIIIDEGRLFKIGEPLKMASFPNSPESEHFMISSMFETLLRCLLLQGYGSSAHLSTQRVMYCVEKMPGSEDEDTYAASGKLRNLN